MLRCDIILLDSNQTTGPNDSPKPLEHGQQFSIAEVLGCICTPNGIKTLICVWQIKNASHTCIYRGSPPALSRTFIHNPYILWL